MNARCKFGDRNPVAEDDMCRAHFDAHLRIAQGLPGWPEVDEDGNELPDPPDLYAVNGRKHGEARTYFAGCRCDLCRKARNAYQQERRNKTKEKRLASRALSEAMQTENTQPKENASNV